MPDRFFGGRDGAGVCRASASQEIFRLAGGRAAKFRIALQKRSGAGAEEQRAPSRPPRRVRSAFIIRMQRRCVPGFGLRRVDDAQQAVSAERRSPFSRSPFDHREIDPWRSARRRDDHRAPQMYRRGIDVSVRVQDQPGQLMRGAGDLERTMEQRPAGFQGLPMPSRLEQGCRRFQGFLWVRHGLGVLWLMGRKMCNTMPPLRPRQTCAGRGVMSRVRWAALP